MSAPWRSPLARALHLNRSLPYARYLQLATVRQDGKPANRTVVFRGFLGETNQLRFITDARSEKIGQIAARSWGEACWYFPQSREQFRLLGALTLVDVGHPEMALQQARRNQWRELSDAARLQFFWPASGQPRDPSVAFASTSADPEHPPTSFCLLLLNPVQVDHLELRGDPQNRHHYQQDAEGKWLTQNVNP